MTVKELRKLLFDCDDENEICLGVQGYLTEYNADDEIIVKRVGNTAFIVDNCYYSEMEDKNA